MGVRVPPLAPFILGNPLTRLNSREVALLIRIRNADRPENLVAFLRTELFCPVCIGIRSLDPPVFHTYASHKIRNQILPVYAVALTPGVAVKGNVP